MDKKNLDEWFARFNEIMRKVDDQSNEEREWIDHFKTYFAIALIKDVGNSMASDIADLVSAICMSESR